MEYFSEGGSYRISPDILAKRNPVSIIYKLHNYLSSYSFISGSFCSTLSMTSFTFLSSHSTTSGCFQQEKHRPAYRAINCPSASCSLKSKVQLKLVQSKSSGPEVLFQIISSSNYREVDIKIYNPKKSLLSVFFLSKETPLPKHVIIDCYQN